MQLFPITLVLCFALLSVGEASWLRDVHVQTSRDSAEEATSDFAEVNLGSMITTMLRGEGPTVHDVAKAADRKISKDDAMRRLQGKLPTYVASVIQAQAHATGKAKGDFSEASLLKALKILNGMIEKAWKDLDDKIIECKEFQERNRGTFDQVMTDLARLGEQISDLERQRAEANEGISTQEFHFYMVVEQKDMEVSLFWKTYFENKAEITIRRNDLAVVQFIMEITKCDDTAMLVQVGSNISASPGETRVCSASAGGLELRFDNPKLEAEAERRMTPNARKAIHEMLSRVNVQTSLLSTKATLLQRSREDPTTVTTTTTTGVFAPVAPVAPVQTEPNPAGQWKKCVDGTPNCGLLHDNMSLMWGKFKDLVDELQAEMDTNMATFNTLKANFNEQLMVIGVAKARYNMMLAEVVSNMNADHEESGEKEQQRSSLDAVYFKKMQSCKAKIEEILYTNICGVRSVRNEVMSHSTAIPTDSIKDCDVADWIPGDCSMPCDDSCPKDDPYACGGWLTLAREVVDKANEHGVQCPALERKKKCNQIKCPVDCAMSQWSGWSKCTKECESGVQGRTRSVVTKPRNGGQSCNTVQETRPCNTGSCDRACTMDPWTEWSPCTMACSGGMQERLRKVLVPTRGNGECPRASSALRLNERGCNEQECAGDEICIGFQDLIIAIDGSGSLRESGFETLRNFAADLIDSYQSKYYGHEAMKVGVVQFGNGEVAADGSVTPAIQVHKLTDDLTAVKASIKALTWKRGFTNMAQAFTLAGTMFQRGGRSEAQSAVAVLTDGKPSFLWQTSQKIQQLKDKNVKLFFAPVVQHDGKELELMKSWASQPWESHLVHIPGLLALKSSSSVFAQKIVATFCPEAMSPSQSELVEKSLGFLLVKEKGLCGRMGKMLHGSGEPIVAGDCAALAQAASASGFALGRGFLKGFCYVMELTVDKAKMDAWAADRVNPACDGAGQGGWTENEFYDQYALEPMGTM